MCDPFPNNLNNNLSQFVFQIQKHYRNTSNNNKITKTETKTTFNYLNHKRLKNSFHFLVHLNEILIEK